MVKNIKANGNINDSQINDFSKSVIQGSVLIGNMKKSPKKLSDCEKREVPSDLFKKAIRKEIISGTASLIMALVTQFALAFFKGTVSLERVYAIVALLVVFILALLAGAIMLYCGIQKASLFRKLESSSEFIEMPSEIFLFAQLLDFLSKEDKSEGKYTRKGKLYRSENGIIFEYLNAGFCDDCEEQPKGKLEIRKTGERQYECVCNQNPKHVFDFDFTKNEQ